MRIRKQRDVPWNKGTSLFVPAEGTGGISCPVFVLLRVPDQFHSISETQFLRNPHQLLLSFVICLPPDSRAAYIQVS